MRTQDRCRLPVSQSVPVKMGTESGSSDSHDDIKAPPSVIRRRIPPVSLADELASRIAAGRWHAKNGPGMSGGSESEEEGSSEEDETAAFARLVRSQGSGGSTGEAGLGYAAFLASLRSSADILLVRAWMRSRAGQCRRAARDPVTRAVSVLLLHALALLLALCLSNGSSLRPPDGTHSALLGTLAFLAALGTGAIGRSMRSLLQEKDAGKEEAVIEAAWARSLARPDPLALPLLWLSCVVSTISIWTRAALTLGLPPVLAALAVFVPALALIRDCATLRLAWEGMAEEEGGGGGVDPDPPGLHSLGGVPLPAPAPAPSRLLLTRAIQDTPDRFKGIGTALLCDRAASLLCMLSGLARSSCAYTASPTPSSPAASDTLEGALAAVLASSSSKAVTLDACRSFHSSWTHAALAALLALHVAWSARAHACATGGDRVRGVWGPALMPLAAACLLAIHGLLPSRGPHPLNYGEGAQCGLEEASTEREYGPPLAFAAMFALGWSAVQVGDAGYLHAMTVSLSDVVSAVPASTFPHLPLLPQACTGMLLSCLLVVAGIPALQNACTEAVGRDAAYPLPYFGVAFVLAATATHVFSAWECVRGGCASLRGKEMGEGRGMKSRRVEGA